MPVYFLSTFWAWRIAPRFNDCHSSMLDPHQAQLPKIRSLIQARKKQTEATVSVWGSRTSTEIYVPSAGSSFVFIRLSICFVLLVFSRNNHCCCFLSTPTRPLRCSKLITWAELQGIYEPKRRARTISYLTWPDHRGRLRKTRKSNATQPHPYKPLKSPLPPDSRSAPATST